jgi:hypothetical protein
MLFRHAINYQAEMAQRRPPAGVTAGGDDSTCRGSLSRGFSPMACPDDLALAAAVIRDALA